MTQSKQIAALLRKPVTGQALQHVTGGAKSNVPAVAAVTGDPQPKRPTDGDQRRGSY